MSTGPHVTIAVPTFRAAALIGPTIASALEQTYERLRVVVVDNCSDDGTTAIVDRIAKGHPRGDIVDVIRYDDNVGRIANWNRCLDVFAAGDGDYLKFLFAGDRLYPECVAELAEAAVKSQAVLASSVYEIVDGETSQAAVHFESGCVLSAAEALAASVRRGNWFGAPSVILVSRAAATAVRFSPDFAWAGDWKFCLDACARGRSVWLNRPLATVDLAGRRFYRERATRFSSRVEDAWMRYYALDRLRELEPAGLLGRDLERELEQSLKRTLLNGRDLLDVTAGKFVRRLQEAMS